MDPLILKIKRAVEAEVGLPVYIQQRPDNSFELVFADTPPRGTLTNL